MQRFLAISLVLFLSACGFQPLHGQAYRETLTVDLSSVGVNVVGSSIAATSRSVLPRRYAQLLKAQIEDKANPRNVPSEKRYMLDVSFTENDLALFVNPDGTASRGDLNYASNYSLKRLSDGKIVASGSILRISSYNSSPTADFASYVSIEDARKRGINELAEDYTLRLATLLPTLNMPDGTAIAPVPQAPIPELQPVRIYETIRSGN
ncbi:MAG: hypothetical protein K2X09_05890 [Rickettsiales bacterium]|nr:hypothetical protein [Rickettsiales bacterium]